MGRPTSASTSATKPAHSLARVSVSVVTATASDRARPLEHELVVAGLERQELHDLARREAELVLGEPHDLVDRRELVRVAAEPVDQVGAQRHAAVLLVFACDAERVVPASKLVEPPLER